LTHSVVIVDDEPPARAKLLRFLAPLPDFRVVAEADSVDTAVAEIIAHQPDIVFLDIQLGDRSGFEVIEAIRGQRARLFHSGRQHRSAIGGRQLRRDTRGRQGAPGA
jgi:DNA-binding NarL/FixJ family response regulator